MKTALITGITGQDGSYLSELLLSKGYKVVGLVRRSSSTNLERIKHIEKDIELASGDLLDKGSIDRIMKRFAPDEVYNLAAQSFVPASWKQPEFTANVTALGTLRLLESMRDTELAHTRFYQASTSEMFGKVRTIPQNEMTPFYPRSPYGVAKCYAHWITVNYRESYDMYATSGILFNHESPRRGLEFVTRKISYSVARIASGLQEKLYLGNLDAKRDWGFAGDYVDAMWRMLQLPMPDTFVIGTDETHTVREFVELAFSCVNLNYEDYIEVSPELYRPAEVDILISDSTKARFVLKWEPKTSFKQLIEMMVESDLEKVFNEERLRNGYGRKILQNL